MHALVINPRMLNRKPFTLSYAGTDLAGSYMDDHTLVQGLFGNFVNRVESGSALRVVSNYNFSQEDYGT